MVTEEEITKAVNFLRSGGVVAFPTETVYGLGADAKSRVGLKTIFAVKGRPENHPLIVHISNMEQLSEWAINISDNAKKLAAAFWPGPLTMIFEKAPEVLDLITGSQNTIGVRIPKHPIAQALLKSFGSGIAAPSANRFGRISPTTAQAVREELGQTVDLVLEGDQCEIGLESTIVDVSGDQPVILRPGMITAEQIALVLEQPLLAKKVDAPRVSGSHETHYAPTTRTSLMESGEILQLLADLTEREFPVALLSHSQCPVKLGGVEWVSMPDSPSAYAHDLYETLRALDKKGFRRLIIESVPEDAEWDAIRDRLARATTS